MPALLALGLALVAGCGRASGDPAPAGASVDEPPAAEASARPAEPGPGRASAPLPDHRPSIEREPFLGVVVPRETVDVSADLAGRLESVEVRVGDSVERGEALARVDVQPLRQELSAAEASLGAARAELSRRAAELGEAEKRHRRRENIPETFSREELEQTALDLETARAAHQGAEARLDEQRARVRRLRELLGNGVLRAPFRGTVALRHLDPGATVAPGTPVVRLIADDELFVRFAVPADRADALETGASVSVSLAGVETPVPATVRHVAPEIDAASRMVFVEARLDGAAAESGGLRSGVVARVRLGGAG
ncbi:MAG: efflux RND transporter periplasmic adaptor subunit [Acidobacteriota bacterium]|jgi:RND family efflux transporter MFP subunit